MPIRQGLLAAGLLLILGGQASAQQPERNRSKAQPAAPTTYTTVERNVIINYYRTHRVEVKPLPPGIARNLARGKPLPPGIAKQRIPADLSSRLVVRSGFQSLIIGDKIVLIDPVGIVVDILSEIF
jgi:hypothetical protein